MNLAHTPTSAILPELEQDRDEGDIHSFTGYPPTCPNCAAALATSTSSSQYYTCGASYEVKPQIQTHTNKWWGVCTQASA